MPLGHKVNHWEGLGCLKKSKCCDILWGQLDAFTWQHHATYLCVFFQRLFASPKLSVPSGKAVHDLYLLDDPSRAFQASLRREVTNSNQFHVKPTSMAAPLVFDSLLILTMTMLTVSLKMSETFGNFSFLLTKF